jgi:hypothetical protein
LKPRHESAKNKLPYNDLSQLTTSTPLYFT